MQLIFNGAISAGIYFIMGVGFALIYRSQRFFHFAHAVVCTFGCYSVLLFGTFLGLPLLISIPLGIALSAILGGVMEVGIYRPLRRLHASSMTLSLASIGLYISLQSILSLVFGDDAKIIRTTPLAQGIRIFGASVTPIQIITACLSVLLVIALSTLMKNTRIGKAIRAVCSDDELATIYGIKSDQILLLIIVIGSALSGLAGILLALDIDLTPSIGMSALMPAVVVAILGMERGIHGIAISALLLGLARHLAVWQANTRWQEIITFGILLLVLTFRPKFVSSVNGQLSVT